MSKLRYIGRVKKQNSMIPFKAGYKVFDYMNDTVYLDPNF